MAEDSKFEEFLDMPVEGEADVSVSVEVMPEEEEAEAFDFASRMRR